MVKIRLTRYGSKKRPFYRIIVIESSKQREGRPIEFLGFFDPIKTKDTKINSERAKHWIKLGAQPTDRVRDLLSQAGVLTELHNEKAKSPKKPKNKRKTKSSQKDEKVAKTSSETSVDESK